MILDPKISRPLILHRSFNLAFDPRRENCSIEYETYSSLALFLVPHALACFRNVFNASEFNQLTLVMCDVTTGEQQYHDTSPQSLYRSRSTGSSFHARTAAHYWETLAHPSKLPTETRLSRRAGCSQMTSSYRSAFGVDHVTCDR